MTDDRMTPAETERDRYYSMPPHVREQVMPHYGETNDQRNARELFEARAERLERIRAGLEREAKLKEKRRGE